MNALIALGILAILLVIVWIFFGWIHLVGIFCERWGWPLWVEVCIALTPIVVIAYCGILADLSAS